MGTHKMNKNNLKMTLEEIKMALIKKKKQNMSISGEKKD